MAAGKGISRVRLVVLEEAGREAWQASGLRRLLQRIRKLLARKLRLLSRTIVRLILLGIERRERGI